MIARFCGVQRKYSRLCHVIAAPRAAGAMIAECALDVWKRTKSHFHSTQPHPTEPHQIKQPLSKIAVNEIVSRPEKS